MKSVVILLMLIIVGFNNIELALNMSGILVFFLVVFKVFSSDRKLNDKEIMQASYLLYLTDNDD